MDIQTPDSKTSPPPGGAPPDPKPSVSAGSSGQSAADMVAEAKASGALKPLEDLQKEMGWDMDAGTMLLLAQKKAAPGTQGKSPDELAQMLRDDPGVYKDLQELQPGGRLDKYGKQLDEAEPVEESGTEGVEGELAEYMSKSDMLKGGDVKKGMDAMKKAGARSPKDMEKNVEMKSSFLSKMGR